MYSDIAKRFTDLFADVFPDDNGAHKPEITKIGDTFFDEKLIHKTARGELVRSKSEVIIANVLNAKDDAYRYECPLDLGSGLRFYPDFMILSRKTRKVILWEHFGMMGNPEYAENAVAKIHLYQKHGYFLGDNLIATFESQGHPLDPEDVRRIASKYL